MSKSIFKALSGSTLGLLVITTMVANFTELASEKTLKNPQQDLPVLAIDLHDTVLERDNKIAIKEILKTPMHGFKFIKRALQYKKAKNHGQTRVSIEEYITKNSQDPEFDQMVAKTVSCFKPIPGAIRFLNKLKQAGYKIFVFSNIGPKSYELLCQDYPELFSLFDGQVIVNPTNLTKDSPEAYKYCIKTITEKIGYIPKKIILYDDSQANCDLAKQTDPLFDAIVCQNSSRKKLVKSNANLLRLLESYSPGKKLR